MHKRRSQYIVAMGFQLRFSVLLAGIGLTVTVVVGCILYLILADTQDLLRETGAITSPVVIDFLIEQRRLFIYSLLGIFFGVTLLLLTFGIFISHKIAGPIFALTRKMNALAHGNFNATLELRKGDEFHDLKERYNTLVHALHNQVQSELIKINGMIESLESVLSEKDFNEETKYELRKIYRDLQTYYTYKKGLIEPESPERFKPDRLDSDDVLI